jgi:RNA polymerase sigma factor (sigma-70 family)
MRKNRKIPDIFFAKNISRPFSVTVCASVYERRKNSRVTEQTAGESLALNDAFEKLEVLDERKSRVVDMRFFGGMKESEIAEALNINEKTVRRDRQFAKLWLFRELSEPVEKAGD